MQNIMTIYRRESAAFFNSPIAYIFIFAFLAIMAIFFFIVFRFFSQTNPDLRAYFEFLPWAFPIFIPAITMGLWSEEKKQGTMELLMTLPVNSWEVVLAKYFASYTIVAIYLLLTVSVPVSVSFVMDLDSTALVANYVGAFLIAGVFLAIGSWLSALTENQVVAFVLGVVVCYVVFLMGLPNVIDWINQNSSWLLLSLNLLVRIGLLIVVVYGLYYTLYNRRRISPTLCALLLVGFLAFPVINFIVAIFSGGEGALVKVLMGLVKFIAIGAAYALLLSGGAAVARAGDRDRENLGSTILGLFLFGLYAIIPLIIITVYFLVNPEIEGIWKYTELQYTGRGLGHFIGYFGTYCHYQKFAQGQISMLDVVYSLSMIGLFLGLNNFAVESRKY